MTDKEIIEALGCCVNEGFQECEKCPLYTQNEPCRKTKLPTIALDLINRQKAEIERLQNEIGSLNKAYPCTVKMNDYFLVYARSLDDYDKLIGDISAEAIKEFEYRITMECAKVMTIFQLDVMKEIIEDVKQEMVGDDNA